MTLCSITASLFLVLLVPQNDDEDEDPYERHRPRALGVRKDVARLDGVADPHCLARGVLATALAFLHPAPRQRHSIGETIANLEQA